MHTARLARAALQRHPMSQERNPEAATHLRERYLAVRGRTEALAAPLSDEDACAQSMLLASPAKWHLAHTTWFFETFVLPGLDPLRGPYDASFRMLFNSYYEAVGPRPRREWRGLLTRPARSEISAYRAFIDACVLDACDAISGDAARTSVFELGLAHEEQHQELILTDIKHLFSLNPLEPAYLSGPPERDIREGAPPVAIRGLDRPFDEHEGGVVLVGHDGVGFSFDNELSRHKVLLEPYEIAARLVTNADYLEFIEDGGYRRPELWLSDGYRTVLEEGWSAPLYWARDRGAPGSFSVFTLRGRVPIAWSEPVCHVSYYEADAFARWAGARLPTEAEWEGAAARQGPCSPEAVEPAGSNFLESGRLHPRPVDAGAPSLLGDTWQWTASAYLPYPGYRAVAGALGEYNGKFMVGSMVLRGGSCLTSKAHIRTSYRNYFSPGTRWQMSGIRLARTS